MEQRILEALTERGYQVESLEEARRQLSQREILKIFREYEGIIGYPDTIIRTMTLLGFMKKSTTSIQPTPCKVVGQLTKLLSELEQNTHSYASPPDATPYSPWDKRSERAAKFQKAIDQHSTPTTITIDSGLETQNESCDLMQHKTLGEICTDSACTVLIRYDDYAQLEVYVNGKELDTLQSFEFHATNGRLPTTYDCTVFMPTPNIGEIDATPAP